MDAGALLRFPLVTKPLIADHRKLIGVLTKEIYRDHDIPTDANKVKVIHLQHLAEWQKKLVERRSKIHRREIARLEALREKP